MVSPRISPSELRPSSGGWALASVLGLLGLALATEYLFSRNDRSAEPSPSPSGEQTLEAQHGHVRRATETFGDTQGWKGILPGVYGNISKHRLLALAAGMTYYSILAIFPAIAALVAVYGLFSDPTTIARHLDQLGGFLPGGAVDVAREQLRRVASKGSQTLGLTSLAGLGLSVWSANAATKSLFDTLNIVHDEEEKRGFVKLNAISLSFTVGGVMFIVAALGSIVVFPVILSYVGFSDWGDLLLRTGRWPAMFLVLTFTLAIVYHYGPSRKARGWRLITSGGAIAALLWLIVSGLFSWYAANFGKFNETYGSLGAIVGFMTWLWVSAIVILLGAEVDAEIERQTARDTTTGSPFDGRNDEIIDRKASIRRCEAARLSE
jgi:membrane protein